MIDLDRYNKLKQQADRLKSDADKAKGKLSHILSQLQEEFGCKNLVDAKKLLAKLEKAADAAEAEYETALEAFEANWGEHLK